VTLLLYATVFALGGLAGALLTEKDPWGVLLYHLKRSRYVFLFAMGGGFAAALLWRIFR
jgi:hypothetical protein